MKNIDEMPAGREMNALVAEKVMGQTNFNHVGFFWTEGTTKDGRDGWDGFACPRCNRLEGDIDKCCERYSTDIAAAWLVVEKLNMAVIPLSDDGWHDDGTYEYPKRLGWVAIPNGVHENIYAGQWSSYSPFEEEGHWEISETVPLAICRAALKSVGITEYEENK